jgi:hypothetical protein
MLHTLIFCMIYANHSSTIRLKTSCEHFRWKSFPYQNNYGTELGLIKVDLRVQHDGMVATLVVVAMLEGPGGPVGRSEFDYGYLRAH